MDYYQLLAYIEGVLANFPLVLLVMKFQIKFITKTLYFRASITLP